MKIKNAIVVTMDANKRILNNASIDIKNDKIVEISTLGGKEKISYNEDDDIIDASGMVVLPGLINCHVHTVQTLFRGIANNHTFTSWLQKYIYPMEAVMNAEEVYTSS